MALKAGRVGVAPTEVDSFGKIIGGGSPGSDYYTKTQTDNKFETKTHVNNTFQKINLSVPISMLSGTMLTVEDALQGLQSDKQDRGGSDIVSADLINTDSSVTSGKVYKIGKIVILSMKLGGTNLASNTWLGYVPEGFRPITAMRETVLNGGTYQTTTPEPIIATIGLSSGLINLVKACNMSNCVGNINGIWLTD